jgi:hypothetical protein
MANVVGHRWDVDGDLKRDLAIARNECMRLERLVADLVAKQLEGDPQAIVSFHSTATVSVHGQTKHMSAGDNLIVSLKK